MRRPDPEILILRDTRESERKCSLTPLKELPGIQFVKFQSGRRLDAAGRILLTPEGPELSSADGGKGLVLVDCNWRRAPLLRRSLEGPVIHRSLPRLITAYPRKSQNFEDPEAGLASVEALYAATVILGWERRDLLSQYRWAQEFLGANPSLVTLGI